MSGTDCEIGYCGESILLLPERCLFWPAKRILVAADLHWGKAEVFQQSGVAVSSHVLRDDLAKLSRALARTQAHTLYLLGDLIHAKSGVTASVMETVAVWRSQHSDLAIELVPGNHDKGFSPPDEWRIHTHFQEAAIHVPPFLFTHEPPSAELRGGLCDRLHTISGHIHPVVRLRSSGDSLRLPCFAIGKNQTLLPAFSAFTGGFALQRREWSRLFVTTDNAVIEV